MYLLSLCIALYYEIFIVGDEQDVIILHSALGQNEEHELVRVESWKYAVMPELLSIIIQKSITDVTFQVH